MVYLPPYCPEYSPIELMFSQVKAELRRTQHVPLDPLVKLDNALASVTLKQGIEYFRKCGYALGDAALGEALALGAID